MHPASEGMPLPKRTFGSSSGMALFGCAFLRLVDGAFLEDPGDQLVHVAVNRLDHDLSMFHSLLKSLSIQPFSQGVPPRSMKPLVSVLCSMRLVRCTRIRPS